MKQFFLAAILIALPVAAFTAAEIWLLPGGAGQTAAAASPGSLGELSAYEAIVADTRDLVGSGNLAAAETRITDFETKWDDAEATMRPEEPAAWGNVDAAADAAFAALRARTPDAAEATKALVALSAVLADPAGAGSSGGVERVAGIAVTDANGHPIPCESMLAELHSTLQDSSLSAKMQAKAADLQAKATERCNADDDGRADAFAAQALALERTTMLDH